MAKIINIPLLGRYAIVRDKGGAAKSFPGGTEYHTNLKARVTRANGTVEDYDFGSGVVTDVGADKVALAFNAGFTLSTFNYHDSGTGTTAAAVGDTALQTQAGPATRATGTQTNPATKQYRSVGTVSYTGALAITEWGLFNQAAQGGSLFDRKVFSAINVGNGDSIQFTYTLSVTSGG